jgi:hypothetical protein
MNGRGKSDRPICTVEAAEQKRVRLLLAEAVEGRGPGQGKFVPTKQVLGSGPGKDEP